VQKETSSGHVNMYIYSLFSTSGKESETTSEFKFEGIYIYTHEQANIKGSSLCKLLIEVSNSHFCL